MKTPTPIAPPADLKTAEDYMQLGAYWRDRCRTHGDSWGSCYAAYDNAASKYVATGQATEAAQAMVERDAAAKAATSEWHSPICNGVDCAPSCRPVR